MMTSQGPSPPFEPRPTGFFTGAVKWVYQPWRSSSPNADPKNKNAALPPRSQPNRRHARLMARAVREQQEEERDCYHAQIGRPAVGPRGPPRARQRAGARHQRPDRVLLGEGQQGEAEADHREQPADHAAPSRGDDRSQGGEAQAGHGHGDVEGSGKSFGEPAPVEDGEPCRSANECNSELASVFRVMLSRPPQQPH